MGCNSSKENSKINQKDEEKKQSLTDGSQENHVTEDTKSCSAKTITLHPSTGEKEKENQKEEEEAAATRIQAVFRGHKTRKSMKQPQQQQQQEKDAATIEMENEFQMDDPELCHAATRIQANFRGHLTRKHIDSEKAKGDDGGSCSKEPEQKQEELDIDLTDPDLNKAAAKIQASFRGHLTRKDGHGDHASGTSASSTTTSANTSSK